MFKSLRTSRGYGKFMRNRAAKVALVVIAAYFALAAWVVGLEVVQWVGQNGASALKAIPELPARAWKAVTWEKQPDWPKGAQWWDLRDDPVLGLLLPESAARRVGPKWVPGLGLRASAARREDHLGTTIDLFKSAVARLPEDAAATPEQVRAVLSRDEFRFGERTMVLPAGGAAELRAKVKGVDDAFQGLVTLKKRREQIAKADVALRAVEEKAQIVRGLARGIGPDGSSSPTETDPRHALDDLAAAVEEVGFVVEDYRQLITADPDSPAEPNQPAEGGPARPLDPLAAINPDDFTPAADALRDLAAIPPTGDVPLPTALLERVRSALPLAQGAIEAPLNEALDRIEPLVVEIMPAPTGFAGGLYAFKLALGTDSAGRSIMVRSLYSAKIAIQVGCVVALAAVIIGAVLGSLAGYYGSWVDALVTWLYSTLSSLPQLVLLGVITFMFLGSKVDGTLIPVYVALTLTFWIGTCRVIRGEVLKLKELEYVQAGKAIGFNRLYILRKHVVPNTMHLLFINFSLLFIGAIKSEVILTYLGLGVKEGSSWGRMISDSAPEVVGGFFWQISAATVFMLVLVLAFNVLSDALQDAFDPKHVG